jgi:hypothetical protein
LVGIGWTVFVGVDGWLCMAGTESMSILFEKYSRVDGVGHWMLPILQLMFGAKKEKMMTGWYFIFS